MRHFFYRFRVHRPRAGARIVRVKRAQHPPAPLAALYARRRQAGRE